jgi:hypothetical protein
MTEPDVLPHGPKTRRFQFSLATLLLWTAVACLAVSMVVMNRKLVRTQYELAESRRQLAAMHPLPLEEVARQFEAHASLGPVRVKVEDVRYSTKDDAYKIRFSWTDSTTGQTWSSDIKLVGDGFGAYVGTIHNDPFVKLLGYKNGFPVAIASPSTFAKQ